MLSMRSKNIGTQISSGKAEKTYEKLANDTDGEEQDNQRVALLFWELLLHKP